MNLIKTRGTRKERGKKEGGQREREEEKKMEEKKRRAVFPKRFEVVSL